MDAYWRAANYLSVGQIYLFDNPLLKEPLQLKHIKPRLLGHWGTTPGLNFISVHLSRVIKEYDLSVVYVTGPGHGGPGLVANAYLEGTYSEVYPNIGPDEAGLKRLFTQFSFPGGIPSHVHVAPETPGSIHEGGELGPPPPPAFRGGPGVHHRDLHGHPPALAQGRKLPPAGGQPCHRPCGADARQHACRQPVGLPRSGASGKVSDLTVFQLLCLLPGAAQEYPCFRCPDTYNNISGSVVNCQLSSVTLH
jgi:hypothetical protein